MPPGSGLVPVDSLYNLKLQIAGQITRGNYLYTLVTDPDLRASWTQVRRLLCCYAAASLAACRHLPTRLVCAPLWLPYRPSRCAASCPASPAS